MMRVIKTNSDMAIEILQLTNDGRDLYQTASQIEKYGRNGDGWQLGLVQLAVNNHLSEFGVKMFKLLYEQVKANDYLYGYEDFKKKFLETNCETS